MFCPHLLESLKNKMINSSLENLGYQYREVAEQIFLVENFFTSEEVAPLWEIINNAKQEDWEKDYRNSQIDLAEKKFGRSDIENLIEEGLVEYTVAWADKAIEVEERYVTNLNKKIKKIFSFNKKLKSFGITTIQRQYEGSPLIEHVDNHGDPSVAYACIGYLNDDYSDGNLFFKNLDFKIKPPANSLLIFPSGEKYLHGVESPGPGPHRYALPMFAVYSGFFDNME